MGCVPGIKSLCLRLREVMQKLSNKKLRKRQRERSISFSTSAPNQMVTLASSTYGVPAEVKCKAKEENNQSFSVDVKKSLNRTKSSESDPIEEENAENSDTEDQTVTTINVWELMAGLDDIEESPEKKCAEKQTMFFDKTTSFYHTVDEIDASENKSFAKENAMPKQISTPGKLKNGFDLSSLNKNSNPLGEIDFNKSVDPLGEIDVKVGFHVASVPSKYYPFLFSLFEKTLENLSEEEWNVNRNAEGQRHRKSPRDGGFSWAVESHKNKGDPLGNIEEKCPPGGANAVVLYTTTLRGIRKTFEDCNNVRDALQNYGICISERDVSMHLEFRNELRKLMGGEVVTVPRVFIKGRYIGGADEVLRLHEEGKMAGLLAGIPTGMAGRFCDGCGGVRFVPCLKCSGSCKLVAVSGDNLFVRCPQCNENGLIQCPICC